MVVRNLHKDFRKRGKDAGKCCRMNEKFTAVDDTCFGIRRGECFGLLGINGAGKTTTFQMLTAKIAPTRGSATLLGIDMIKDSRRAQQKMGYCPQFEALLEFLTGEELLYFFARLRGIPERQIPQLCKTMLHDMTLMPHADKPCGRYSGGNKRKLSTAIALLGSPPIVFLDEPTSGMDPGAKRFLWRYLQKVKATGRSIVLTSHSMEECEALCDRLAIMVKGQFRCLGEVQHLKSKFGDSNFIIVKFKEHNLKEIVRIKDLVYKEFGGIKLLEEASNYLHFEVPAVIPLSKLFAFLGVLKSKGNLEDFSVCQVTLDHVFQKFARAGNDSEGCYIEPITEVLVAPTTTSDIDSDSKSEDSSHDNNKN